MKRGFIIGLATMLFLIIIVGFVNDKPEAFNEIELSEPTPELIIFELAPTSTPVPIPTPTPGPITINEYNLNEEDVETVARLLWSSPLRDRTAKAALIWVVCNRVDSKDFPSTITDVISKTEFSFYDKRAHLSEENLELTKLVLNQWLSERDGFDSGRLVSKDGLFIRFEGENNRSLGILDARGGKTIYYPIAGAYEY